ncbi:MAG: hypothetical protein J4F29_16760 [Candidatus Latescibacteria bacterium]|nr:hypothetical protein [Candidatus Latescibacterota bacterium]
MELNTSDKYKNLHLFDDQYFVQLIQHHILEYHAHFAERLISIYVWGSVHRNEAIQGISDLDLHPFIRGPLRKTDHQWCRETQERLDREFPRARGLCPPRSIDDVLQSRQPGANKDLRSRHQALGFRLHYDATLVWGSDLTGEFELPTFTPSWVKEYFQPALDLTRYAAGLKKENTTDFSLSNETRQRLRKLARLGVLGGACLLMAQGRFRSFKGVDTIPVLKASYPQWTDFFDETQELYIHLTRSSNERVSRYLSQLVKWMDWIEKQLK